jgi:hypothetical protein
MRSLLRVNSFNRASRRRRRILTFKTSGRLQRKERLQHLATARIHCVSACKFAGRLTPPALAGQIIPAVGRFRGPAPSDRQIRGRVIPFLAGSGRQAGLPGRFSGTRPVETAGRARQGDLGVRY